MDKKAWPYLAGLVDSEGSISIGITRNPSGKESFSLNVKITNTNKDLMKWLIHNFGGVYSTEIKSVNSFSPGSKIYNWRCLSEQQEALFLGLLPYIIVKRNQVLLGLDFRRSQSVEERRSLYEKIQEYNQRRIEIEVPDFIHRSKDSAAYAAGFLDGDGHISVSKGTNPRIAISSTDFILIKWLLAHFGGKFYKAQRKRIIYDWRISGASNKERFLLKIIPHLQMKKEQAKLALEILRLRKKNPKGGNLVIKCRSRILMNRIVNLNS